MTECEEKLQNTNKPSLELLTQAEARAEIEVLLAEYGEAIAPRIFEYEVEARQFPVEVLNEIRSIYAHLYRAATVPAESENAKEQVLQNIRSAKGHSKRAALDSDKFLCVLYDDRYHEFLDRFSNVDWKRSCLTTEFKALQDQRKKAVDQLRLAKGWEGTGNAPNRDKETNSYQEEYEKAYFEYLKLKEMQESLEEKMMGKEGTVQSKNVLWVVMAASIVGFVLGVLLSLLL